MNDSGEDMIADYKGGACLVEGVARLAGDV